LSKNVKNKGEVSIWIPVFPISGRKEYLECPICRQVYDVPKD